MEGTYPVFFGQAQVGKVQVRKQGLYYRIFCRCRMTGDVVCRLTVQCGQNRENLGVVVPVEECFGLEKSVPCKRLGEGDPEFCLLPKHEKAAGTFVPIYPEEPFAYISRLKKSYLQIKEGQVGIRVS